MPFLKIFVYSDVFKWTPCPQGIESPQVSRGGDGFQVFERFELMCMERGRIVSCYFGFDGFMSVASILDPRFSLKPCDCLKSYRTIRPITGLYNCFRKFFPYVCQLPDMNQTLPFYHKCKNTCSIYDFVLQQTENVPTHSSKKLRNLLTQKLSSKSRLCSVFNILSKKWH